MISIKGWQKSSLIDFPPHTSSVIFLPGCSFRCGFCHNPSLVLESGLIKDITKEEIFIYLKNKKQWIDAVCITGGEPTLQDNLPEFIDEIKKMGFLVKLDTNGSNPIMLKEIVGNVDYIAMDIKSSPEKYSKTCGVDVNTEVIKESAEIVKQCKDYEFRTTVVPGFIEKEDIESIGKWLEGSKKYVLQQFRNSAEMINPMFMSLMSYHKSELESMAYIAKKYFNRVEVRI